MKGEKQVQKDIKKNKVKKDDEFKIITVEAEGSGASEEEARKNLFQAAIKKAADQLILETKTANEANKIKEENTNVNIGTIKKVFEIKFIKKENVIIAKGKVEVESKASQKEKGKKFETVISEGNGKSEEEALQDAIRKGIEKTIGVHIKSVEDLKNGIIKETIIEQLNASVSEKKLLKSIKINEEIKATVFFEVDTSFIFKNLKFSNPIISKFDGASIAAKIESHQEMARQTNNLIDILIDDYYGCYNLEARTEIEKLSFTNEGEFDLTYKYFIDPNKIVEFHEKWVPILEKIKMNKSKTTLKESYKKENLIKETMERNAGRTDKILIINIQDMKDKKIIHEFLIPGYLSGLKNKNLGLEASFEFIDKDEKTISGFHFNKDNKNDKKTQWGHFIPKVADGFLFSCEDNGYIVLKSHIELNQLSKAAGIKAYFRKSN